MFKKFMAKLGVGAATVDLQLEKEAFRLGEEMIGTIRITGGEVEQQIAGLQIEVVLQAVAKGKKVAKVIETIPVLQGFVVHPKPYVQEIPFYYFVPTNLAVSTHSIRYVLRTKLDVVQAFDPTDMDHVTILPPAPIAKVLQAMEQLDFRQKPDSGKLTMRGQEFSFFSARPPSYLLRELDVLFFSTEAGLRLLIGLGLTPNGYLRRGAGQWVEVLIPEELLADGKEAELCTFLGEELDSYANHPDTIPYSPLTDYAPQYGGYSHQHGQTSWGGMIGGMAAGLVGGILLSELIEGASELFTDHETAQTAHIAESDPGLIESDHYDSLDSGGYDNNDSYDDSGGFDGGDFGDF